MSLPKRQSPLDLLASGEGGFAFAVILTLGIMFVPLPAFLLDLLLSLSLSLGIVIFLFALQIRKPLEFSSFPSVLLLTTLLRLALNIASTRRILLHGAEGANSAGYVVEAFGQFMVGGNIVVGIIIFIILVIINFVVITKGANRIAEVSARFTLDSMPGKQMAIDADLASGLCSESEAKTRRLVVEQEADFFGSMDGASKFVRGDAVAGVLVMIVNIVGGLIIGVTDKHLTLKRAFDTYTHLTIGDGLVAQVPALLTSITAGLVTTRASSGERLSGAVGNQLFGRTQTLSLATAVLGMLAILPGMPHVPFMLMTLLLGVLTQRLYQQQQRADLAAVTPSTSLSTPQSPRHEVATALPLALVTLSVGYELLPLVGDKQQGTLFRRISGLRQQLAKDMGIIVPAIHVHDNLRLRANAYTISLCDCLVARGEVRIGRFLAIHHQGNFADIPGENVQEPTFSLPGRWIAQSDTQRAELLGATVVDAPTVITTHLGEILKQYAHELLGRSELQDLLDLHSKDLGKVIEELIPNLLNMAVLIKVLRGLLKERVSIRDFRAILESLADHAQETKDPEQLVELVRLRLGKQIVKTYLQDNNSLAALVLDPQLEQSFRRINQREGKLVDAMEVKNLSQAFEAMQKHFTNQFTSPVILVVHDIRRSVLTFASRYLHGAAVLSFRELDHTVQIHTVGIIAAVTQETRHAS